MKKVLMYNGHSINLRTKLMNSKFQLLLYNLLSYLALVKRTLCYHGVSVVCGSDHHFE